jgi:hypothetical protein
MIDQLVYPHNLKNKVNEIVDEVNIVKQVDTIADLQGLTGVVGQQVSVASYHGLNDLSGGGTFVWGTGRHNGGTFIDPNRAFPTDWSDQGQLAAWFADSGVDVPCWSRPEDNLVVVTNFGAKGDGASNDSKPLQKSADVAAGALNRLVWLPKASIGVYVIEDALVFAGARRFDGDNISIKASATFTGATVPVLPSGTLVLGAMLVFLVGNFDDITGVQRERVFIGSGINLDCNESVERGLYIERMPYSHIACNVDRSTAGAGAIDIGPYCWGSHLDNNTIENFTEAAIKIGVGNNGLLISCPKIWGRNKTGVQGINVKDNANCNGILVSGGFIEKITDGAYVGLLNGPIQFSGVDFEVIGRNVIRAVGDESQPAGRKVGPITLDNCYLDAVGSKLYADRAKIVVRGSRLRLNNDFETVNNGLIFSENNEFENTSPVIVAGSNVIMDEERSWNPVLWDDSFSSGEGQTTTISVGSYKRVGNEIHVKGHIQLSALGTLTGTEAARIGPLPVAASATASSHSVTSIGYASGLALTEAAGLTGYVGVGANYINLQKFSVTTGTTNVLISEIGATGQLVFSVVYLVD